MKYCIAHPVFYWTLLFLYPVLRNKGMGSDIPGAELPIHSQNKEAINKKQSMDFIRSCPIKCSCEIRAQKLTTDCSSKHLKNIPPKVFVATSELKLAHNNMSSLSYDGALTELEILNVSFNSISSLDKSWLSTLQKLQNVDISRNNLQIASVENAFSNTPLSQLNLSFNRLEKITQATFNELSLLKILDLSWNKVVKMDDNSFHSLRNLEELNLSFNHLNHLKDGWFVSLKSLKTLILKRNKLKLLSNLVFTSMNQLKYLDLSENEISSVGLLSFKGLSKLEVLNLSNNNIELIQEGTFRPLESLKVIDLSNNSFRKLDGIFKYSRNVEVLHLKFLRKLKTVTANSFLGLTRLEVLDLSGSQSLTHINQFAFSSTKKLKYLDISYLNLTTLKGGVFKELPQIETITLKGNPWNCDCYLYWLLIWLGENTNAHLLSPSGTVCRFPSHLKGNVLLDALNHDMVCTNASISEHTKNALFRVGSTALLQCHVEGKPMPVLTWVTPQKLIFHWLDSKNGSYISENSRLSQHSSSHKLHKDELENPEKERFLLLKNGDLLIKKLERRDGGFYACVASNPLSNHSVAIRLTLDYGYLVHIKIVSILVGLATSFGFLLLTLISVLIKMILRQCGVKCPCRSGKSSPKSQQIRKILESMEHYKKQQLERLRENYNFQVQRIKDNCMQQMERLRESYSSQAERLRDICDYGTLQIDRIRENYYLQVQRVREYSVNQIERLRENYLLQRNRIRKFSAHHLYKLRENYKLQQQHLNKILENLNIESCRNVCQRTDSIIFEPDITLENVFVPKICLAQSLTKNNSDSVDSSSQVSAYFTPDDAASEISGQESDQHDSARDNCVISSPSIHKSYVNVEITNSLSELADTTDCTNGNIKSLQNAELVEIGANETIV